MASEKSPELLLEAVAVAVPQLPALRLLLVGGGPLEGSLRARAERPDLAGRVHLTGARPRPEALALLRGADLFVFASRTETQGLVLAEALAAGLPAVAVEGPGVRDSIRDGIDGLVVAAGPEPGVAERLAGALVALSDDARRAGMAERAGADAGRFDIALRVAETVALYEHVRRS